MPNPIRLAIIGGNRGGSFDKALQNLGETAQLAAICDPDEGVLARWRQRHAGIRTVTRFEKILDDPGIDAVLIATPIELHAPQSVAALNAGKHVLCEVIAAQTIEECWELVEAVERTKLAYMMAENSCYPREVMMVGHMASQGVFGELTFGECGYIHDCRRLLYTKEHAQTWRARFATGALGRASGYPTHSLGPVAQWMDITRSDRFVRTTTFVTREASRHVYAAALLGKEHPDAREEAWSGACDSASTLIETARGRVILIRYDSASARPHNMIHYGLQGNRGAYLAARHHREDPLAWIDGLSRGSEMPGSTIEPEWQSLWDLAGRYEHPRWKELGRVAAQSGHGGGDFFVLKDFVDAVAARRPPPIDVYDAVTWSCIAPLSAINVKQQGVPVEVPDFLRGKQRTR